VKGSARVHTGDPSSKYNNGWGFVSNHPVSSLGPYFSRNNFSNPGPRFLRNEFQGEREEREKRTAQLGASACASPVLRGARQSRGRPIREGGGPVREVIDVFLLSSDLDLR
jgi:hypothetical protein